MILLPVVSTQMPLFTMRSHIPTKAPFAKTLNPQRSLQRRSTKPIEQVMRPFSLGFKDLGLRAV